MGKHIRTNRIISFNILKDNIEDCTDKVNRNYIGQNYNFLISRIREQNKNLINLEKKDKNYGFGKNNLLNFFNFNDKLYCKSICEFEYMEGDNIVSFTKGYDKKISPEYIKSLFNDEFIEIDEVKYE